MTCSILSPSSTLCNAGHRPPSQQPARRQRLPLPLQHPNRSPPSTRRPHPLTTHWPAMLPARSGRRHEGKPDHSLGAENVTEENVQWVDSETPAIVLYASDPEMRIELLWLDKTTGGPRAIQTSGAKWTGPLGLHTGATMAEVEAANGAPVSPDGLLQPQCRRGEQLSWRQARRRHRLQRHAELLPRLKTCHSEAMEAVNDDPEKVYLSDSPEMRAAKPFLDTIVLSYADPS